MSSDWTPPDADATRGSPLAARLTQACPPDLLVSILTVESDVLKRAALEALGKKGAAEHASIVARFLHADRTTAAIAESCLWQLWLRSGSPGVDAQLADACTLAQNGRLSEALALLDHIISGRPDFAAAHHERGVVLSLMARSDEAAAAFLRARSHNPHHFSAVLSLGHAYVQQGQYQQAAQCYRQALELNPRLQALPELAQRLEDMTNTGPSV